MTSEKTSLTTETETKGYVDAECKALDPSDKHPHGGFEAILSTDAVDRDDEVIDFRAFEPLPDYMPALADHVASISNTVGWGVPTYEDGKMFFRGSFDADPFSQLVRSKLKSGSIRSMSVGFRQATRVMKNGRAHITKGEALEGSFVVIPANADALVQNAKAFADVAPPTGSFEEAQEDVLTALYDRYAMDTTEVFVSLIATFVDSVVYRVSHYPEDVTDGTFSLGYTVTKDEGSDIVTLADEPTQVEVEQVVSPKALALFGRKTGRKNSIEDQQALDMAHDSLVGAGACCPVEQRVEGPTTLKLGDSDQIELTDLDQIEAELTELELDELGYEDDLP